MQSIYDFSVQDHAVMLSDQTRLDAFYNAIRATVKDSDVVVEVGTGTGILSAYAAAITKKPVYAIEAAPFSADLSERMLSSAGLQHVEVLRGKSFDIQLPHDAHVLITETIGALGPEENIVEIIYDLVRRYPSLKSLIPSRLKIFAQPIFFAEFDEWAAHFYAQFMSASFGTFDYEAIRSELEKVWTHQIRYDSFSQAKICGSPIEVIDYHLGVTQDSSFQKSVSLENASKANAFHFYFEAQLSAGVTISTHFGSPSTHWRHAFVSKPKGLSELNVQYSSTNPFLRVDWK